MLVQNLDYLEVVSNDEIEGAVAFATSFAGPNFATGPNVALTSSATGTSSSTSLVTLGILLISSNQAGALSSSTSQSA